MNGFFDCSALNDTFCFNSSSLTFQDGDVRAITNYRTVGASSSSAISGFPSLYFEYVSNSSVEGLVGLPIVHLESISLYIAAIYGLSIRRDGGNDGGFERELVFDRTRSRGCAFTVGSVGNYSIFFSSASPPLRGRLWHDGLFSFFAGDPYHDLYSAVPFYFSTESASSLATPTSSATPPSTPSGTRAPVGPPGSERRGIPTAVIVVPIVVVVLVISVTVLVWLYRRHRQVSDSEYQSVNESFLEVRID
jgi:hypothetical protein